ncbi:cobalamin biosynthesis protein CbiL [Paenirhodobacter populi]|uniref:Cobalamin biosynthesis protein CbiL n=1 Tax=Paenirhodobacter populi TaxID=2306993 RepID=A0A443JPR6_9RHOB|nr:cobalamin biosynthesis protein CbiL [Sinirhodobacter populi]RWR22493.1 cobalamin biosynthesis protein CbiL [Sinirhodobacter populi]
MTRLILPLILFLSLALPAEAHKLRLFATVEGGDVTGYAFFVGGGRAQGADWWAQDAGGARITQGRTDGEGRYRFTAPDPVTDDIAVRIDTHDGHMAEAVVKAERFGAPPVAPVAPAPASLADGGRSAAPAPDTEAVERAVQRQIAPLLERIEAMDSRMRITDVLSGLFLIVGLAGMGLYLRGRR